MKRNAWRVLFCMAAVLGACVTARAEMVRNLAPQAKVSATSEAGAGSLAKFAVDGRIPAAGSTAADLGAAWCVNGQESGNKGDFILEWAQPVEAAEIIYFGRTAWTMECFKDYEIYLNSSTEPAAKGELKAIDGPQRMPFPRARVKKITIRFLNAQPNAPNAGAGEIMVLSGASTDEELDRLVAFRPNGLFSDNMVLQRNRPVPVWGSARDGEKVTVEFRGNKATATAENRRWMITLPAMDVGKPSQLTITSEAGEFKFDNVVVGEVWICSGQSNMEFPVAPAFWPYRYSGVANHQKEVESAKYPDIRYSYVTREATGVPKTALDCSPWRVCSPETVGGMTAIGYFFARNVHESLKVPVGIIDVSWGATMIEPWVSREGFAMMPTLRDFVMAADKGRADYEAALPNVAPGTRPPVGQNQTSALYNAMIHPMIPFAMKGVLWYQGEGNLGQGMMYYDKMTALIRGWRDAWGQGDFPFYYVQLAPFNYPGDPMRLQSVWEAQLASLSIPNTGMAVITDITELGNIHPTNKQDVGKRLALWALANTYRQKGVVPSGPLYNHYVIKGNRVRICFDYADDGLATRDGKDPDWFEIAGADKKFVKALAKLDGDGVIVWSDEVPQPVAVQFGWDKAAAPNLVNKAGLPASPFRTNRWENNTGR